VDGTGWASAGRLLAYFMFPHVRANCHCAAAIDRIDATAEASLPRACMPRYSLNAIASRTAMIARTTINSISVKPAWPRARPRRRDVASVNMRSTAVIPEMIRPVPRSRGR
jgi:hypothetical protein